MGKKKMKNAETEKKNGKEIIKDPRFSRVHTDPRFQKHSKHQSKVTIDSRFNRMFTDKKFASSSASIDKRGKPKPMNSVNPLRDYYKMDDNDDDDEEEEDEMKKKKKNQKYKKKIENEDDEEEDDMKKKKNMRYKKKIESEVDDEEEDEMKKKKNRKYKKQIESDDDVEEEDEMKKKKNQKYKKQIESDDDDEEEDEMKKKKNKKYKKRNESKDEEEEEEEDEMKKKKNMRYKKRIESEDDEEDVEGSEEDSENEDIENKINSDSSDVELNSDVEEELKLLDEELQNDTDDDEDEDLFYSDEEPEEPEEKIPEIDKETHRLAIVNMDWSQITAADLFVVMDSFLPTGGQILSVSVYPSEFGLKRMEEEAVKGPIGLFDSDQGSSDDDDGNDEIDNEKLRAYEISRLRYYFAVVECDSVATADYLYKACDGIEVEKTSNKLDLRFIPDTMQFEHPPRDVATEKPSKYEAVDFHTQALQQSKIRLTWDDDEPQRAKLLKGKWNADELDKLRAFLPSDDDESSDNEDNNGGTTDGSSNKKLNKVDTYRALIEDVAVSDGNGSDNDKDMEVTFNTGLEDISKRIVERNKDKNSETVWEATLRKQKEKKKARKHRSRDSSEESSDSDHEAPEQADDFFLEEPSSRNSKVGKSSRRKEQEEITAKEQEASRAELELLLADDQGADHNLKGYNLKPKKAKGKKGKELPAEDKLPSVDYNDPRFSVLFKSPLFALDPTDAQYKRSAAYARQVVARQQKGLREEATGAENKEHASDSMLPSDITVAQSHISSKTEEPEFSSLVRSLKRKTQQNRENETALATKRVVPMRSNGLEQRLSPKPSKKKARHSKS